MINSCDDTGNTVILLETFCEESLTFFKHNNIEQDSQNFVTT